MQFFDHCVFLPPCGVFEFDRNKRVFGEVERSGEAVLEFIRLNTSLWASVTREFGNYLLGVILVDWKPFFLFSKKPSFHYARKNRQ